MGKYFLATAVIITFVAGLFACAPQPVRPGPVEPPVYPHSQPPYGQSQQTYPQQSPYPQYPQTQPPHSQSPSYPPTPPPGDFSRATIETQSEVRKATARGLRDEAYALQQRGLIREAVGKYRESLAYWPDPGLDAYIATVENVTKLPSSQRIRQWAGQGAAVVKPQGLIATIRNRSNSEVAMRLSETGEGVDVPFLPGEIRELSIKATPLGEITVYVLQGGRIVTGKKWYWDGSDPSAVPVIVYDDKEPDRLMVMTGKKTR